MSTSVPPNSYNPCIEKGDILIQMLCSKSIAQWIVLDIKGTECYHLQLIDREGLFTSRIKVVKGLAIKNYIKDGIATKLMKNINSNN